MPWIIGGLATTEDACMLADDVPILTNDDPVGIGRAEGVLAREIVEPEGGGAGRAGRHRQPR